METIDNRHWVKDLLYLLEFGEDNDIAEEEQVSVRGLRALGDLDTLVQQQVSVLTGEAEDKWTLLHGHPAGSLLPEDTHTQWVGDRDLPHDQAKI